MSRPIIVVPHRRVLSNPHFQQKLREAVKRDFFDSGLSTRAYQQQAENSLYDFEGDVYRADDEGRFIKMPLPNLYEALGEDARWLRGYLLEADRPRRDLYKLMLLSALMAIRYPMDYENLISLY